MHLTKHGDTEMSMAGCLLSVNSLTRTGKKIKKIAIQHTECGGRGDAYAVRV